MLFVFSKKAHFVSVILLCFTLWQCAGTKNTPSAKKTDYDGPITDMHCHVLSGNEIGSMGKLRDGSLNNLMQEIKQANILNAAIITMARKGALEQNKAKNDTIIAISKKDTRLIPVCSVHPYDSTWSLKEMERVNKEGVKFIKLHPNTQNFDIESPWVYKVARKAGELNMVLLFDGYSPFDSDQFGKFVKLALANPRTKFILAHAGFINFKELNMIRILKKYPFYKHNIWVDLSAVAIELVDSPYREQLLWTLKGVGTNRILFGSDYPIYSPKEAIESIKRLGFNKLELEQIFHTNAQRLLKM